MISAILCGGAGSRLWPVSRELHPKPFLSLPNGNNLIQNSFVYASELPGISEIITVTRQDLQFKVAEEFKSTNILLNKKYILEPFGRNTAPAVGIVALDVSARYGDDEPILILAADHLISDKEAFKEAVARAAELAMDGYLVTFGIKPNKPETGFGYIEASGEKVLRFVEKPTAKKAQEYIDSGNFFWNAGMFCFKAGVILDELAKNASDVFKSVKNCFSKSFSCSNQDFDNCLKLESESFALVPDISLDYAVMEKSKKVAVVACDMGWSDLGSWNDLCSMNPIDNSGNHIDDFKNVVMIDTKNCNIKSNDRLVATIGVDDLLIVDTDDALLVANKNRAQDVKNIYNELKARNHEAHKCHSTVYRPWGSYTTLEVGSRFKIKRLEIKPGASISLQLHHHRSEHWIVVMGMAEVTCGDKVFLIDTNESTYIKAGNVHRVANKGVIPLIIIEVQSGDYLGEDDIIRIEDIYGRDTNTI